MDVYQRRRLVALSAIAVVFIVLVLLIKSCGGSDEPTTALTAPVSGASGAAGAVLTKDAYISQADDICLEANTALTGVDESDAQQAATDKGQILSGELQQLQTLSAPEQDASTLNKFLKALQKQVKGYGDQATAAERADDATVAELDTTIAAAGSDAAKAAGKYGFKVCGDTSQVGASTTGGNSSSSSTTSATGGTVTPPATTTPTTVAPPAAAPPTGGAPTATPPATPPATGGTDSSGGVSP